MSALNCDHCEMLSINGIACHERGCPMICARWDAESESWIKQRVCVICGYSRDADDPCCDHEEYQTESDEYAEAMS